jgi:hypothetical protein
MKAGHFNILVFSDAAKAQVHRLSLYFALIVTLAASAMAGVCAPNDNYQTVCTDGGITTCGTPGGGACVVTLSSTAPGVDPEPICIQQGTIIVWNEGVDNSDFKVTFTNSPFNDHRKLFIGFRAGAERGSPSDKVSQLGCFDYKIRHCDDAAAHCVPFDPKVIVGGANFHPHKKAH